jgi:hypothetical protein
MHCTAMQEQLRAHNLALPFPATPGSAELDCAERIAAHADDDARRDARATP